MVGESGCSKTTAGRTLLLGKAGKTRMAGMMRGRMARMFDIDREMERAVLESPRGDLLSQAALSQDERAKMRGQIIEALKRLHANGVVHGDVRMGTVRVGPGRAVLMLPLTKHDATPEADMDAASNL